MPRIQGLSQKKMGDAFLSDKKNLILAVPSVMMPEEINYIINPLHKDMKQVKIINQTRIILTNE